MGIFWLAVVVILGGAFIFYLLYLESSAHVIRREKKIIKHYAELTKDIPQKGSKITTTLEIGKSNSAKCPYCNTVFKISSGQCPSCGAHVSKMDNKIIITKTAENTEILEALKNEHEEKMVTLKNEKSLKRNENFVMLLVMLGLFALIGFIAYLRLK